MDTRTILNTIIGAKLAYQTSSNRLPEKVIMNREDAIMIIEKQMELIYGIMLTPSELEEKLKTSYVFGLRVQINEKLERGTAVIK